MRMSGVIIYINLRRKVLFWRKLRVNCFSFAFCKIVFLEIQWDTLEIKYALGICDVNLIQIQKFPSDLSLEATDIAR